jgi:hypothetical protein
MSPTSGCRGSICVQTSVMRVRSSGIGRRREIVECHGMPAGFEKAWLECSARIGRRNTPRSRSSSLRCSSHPPLNLARYRAREAGTSFRGCSQRSSNSAPHWAFGSQTTRNPQPVASEYASALSTLLSRLPRPRRAFRSRSRRLSATRHERCSPTSVLRTEEPQEVVDLESDKCLAHAGWTFRASRNEAPWPSNGTSVGGSAPTYLSVFMENRAEAESGRP